MILKEIINDLEKSESYKEFIKENKDSYLCSSIIFFGESDKLDLNFFIPSKNKISTFSYPYFKLTAHPQKIENQKEINLNELNLDIKDLKNKVKELTNKDFSKIIAVLQGNVWNLTCLEGINMDQIKINSKTKEVIESKKGSLMDMIRFQKGNKN